MRSELITTHTHEIRLRDGAEAISKRLHACLKGFERTGYTLVSYQVFEGGTVMVLKTDVQDEVLLDAHKSASFGALEVTGDATGRDKEKHFEFLRSYRRQMQVLVEQEMIREGKSQSDIAEFWGNEMPS